MGEGFPPEGELLPTVPAIPDTTFGRDPGVEAHVFPVGPRPRSDTHAFIVTEEGELVEVIRGGPEHGRFLCSLKAEKEAAGRRVPAFVTQDLARFGIQCAVIFPVGGPVPDAPLERPGTEAEPEEVSLLEIGAEILFEQLEKIAKSILPDSFPLPEFLQKVFDLLMDPVRVPGEPCLAPAPLVRDLLDTALGRVTGKIDALVGKVKGTALDSLIPAFATGEAVDRFIQGILDDPVTAALNLVLGQRNQIDCVVEGGLSVGAQVIEAGLRRVTKVVTGALA